MKQRSYSLRSTRAFIKPKNLSSLSFAILAAVVNGFSVLPASQSFAEEAVPSALSETYGDWVVHCAVANRQDAANAVHESNNTCQMSQELRQTKTGQRALLIVFSRNGKDKSVLSGTIIAPFGIDLQAGLSLLIKNDVYVKASYSTCLPQGCLAPIAANDQFEKALQENEKLIVAMMASDTGQPVRLDVSLKGFGQSLERMTALSKRGE